MKDRFEMMVDQCYLNIISANNAYVEGNIMGFYSLVLGIATCKVEAFPGAGHNIQAVVKALHRFAKDNPDSQALKGFEEALVFALDLGKDYGSMSSVMSAVEAELQFEKSGETEFKLDMSAVLDKVSDCATNNHEALAAEMPQFDLWYQHKLSYIGNLK